MRCKSKLADWAKGRVSGYFVNLETGEERGHFETTNVITYTAGDIMARILGGESDYVPGYMGFIYGETGSPGAALIEPPTSRVQTWDGLSAELADGAVGGNILISPLAAGPSYSIDGSSSYYAGNAVTLTAQSGSRLEYGFPSSSPYANELEDGDYYWHAMILTRLVSGSTITYLPFARVTLKDTSYPQKPVGFELALFWQISYF